MIPAATNDNAPPAVPMVPLWPNVMADPRGVIFVPFQPTAHVASVALQLGEAALLVRVFENLAATAMTEGQLENWGLLRERAYAFRTVVQAIAPADPHSLDNIRMGTIHHD